MCSSPGRFEEKQSKVTFKKKTEEQERFLEHKCREIVFIVVKDVSDVYLLAQDLLSVIRRLNI